jgi:hypothetical protein
MPPTSHNETSFSTVRSWALVGAAEWARREHRRNKGVPREFSSFLGGQGA